MSTCSVQPGGTTGRLAILSVPLPYCDQKCVLPAPPNLGGRERGPHSSQAGFGSGPCWTSVWEGDCPLFAGLSCAETGREIAAGSPVRLHAESQCGFCLCGTQAAWCHLTVAHTPSWLWLGAPAPAAASRHMWGSRVHPCPAPALAEHWDLISPPPHPHVGPLAAGCPPFVHGHVCLTFYLPGPRF